MRIDWILSGRGWARCLVSDDNSSAEIEASYISAAPEDLLTAVTRVVLGEPETTVQFEAEPEAFRWVFLRDGRSVGVRLLHLPQGTEVWVGTQDIAALGRVFVRCFDEAARVYGVDGYQAMWGRPFPTFELEALRAAWRAHR